MQVSIELPFKVQGNILGMNAPIGLPWNNFPPCEEEQRMGKYCLIVRLCFFNPLDQEAAMVAAVMEEGGVTIIQALFKLI